MLLMVVKWTLQITLLVLFLQMYGLPAVQKLKRQSTIVIKTTNQTNGIDAPSVTISARDRVSGIGWKKKSSAIKNKNELIVQQCKNFTNIEECLDSETFRWSDFIKDTLLGYETQMPMQNETITWRPDFTQTKFGRAYTFHPNVRIGPNYHKDQIYFLLDKRYTYSIFVHERKFFVMNDNRCNMPFEYVRLIPDASNNYKYLYTLTASKGGRSWQPFGDTYGKIHG